LIGGTVEGNACACACVPQKPSKRRPVKAVKEDLKMPTSQVVVRS
jgi:hypothetical protein